MADDRKLYRVTNPHDEHHEIMALGVHCYVAPGHSVLAWLSDDERDAEALLAIDPAGVEDEDAVSETHWPSGLGGPGHEGETSHD